MKINATRMTTPIEEKLDQKLKVRTGMVTVSDGKSRPIPVQLHLSMEVLRLQKEELVPPEPKPINGKVNYRINSMTMPINTTITKFGYQGENGTNQAPKG